LTDYDRAINELQLGNYSEGMVLLQTLLNNDPDNIDILYNLGICYSEMGLLTKSAEALEKCIQSAPYFANGLVALGFTYYQQGSDEKAMAMLLKALKIEPENVYALKNIGALYNRRGEADQAIACFKKADTLMPDLPDVKLGLGQAYELKEMHDKATAYYMQLKKSYAADIILEKAIAGLNRVAVAQLKAAGHGNKMDAIMHCLSAIELFSKMGSEMVKKIAFEVGLLGTGGLSINDPEKKYTLKSIDGEFSGMQLLCFMFVGFKIIDPNLPLVADLESEYQQALKIHRGRLDEH